jgi:hypothetical protein
MIAVGLLISGLAVGYLVWGLRGTWGGLWAALKEANYLYVIPSVGLIALVYALRVVRWKVLLRPVADVPYSAITSATCIGFMSSCVLPLRPGEVIRPYVLHRKAGVGFGDAVGTALGLERVFDLIGVCFLVVATWLLMLRGGRDGAFIARLAESAVWFAALAAVGLVALGALALFPRRMLALGSFVLKPVPKALRERVLEFASAVVGSMRFLRNPGQVLVATLLSFAIWSLFPASTYALARAFDMDLPPVGAMVVQVCVTAAVALPQAPGFIGPFHVATKKGAELFGVPAAGAGAFALMLWVVNVVPITIVGLAFLRREGLNLVRLARASEQAAAKVEAGGEGETGKDTR